MDEEKQPAVPAEQQIPQEPAPSLQPEVPKEAQQEPQQIAAPVPTQVYVPRKAEAAELKPSRWQKLKDFIVECKRVLRVTKKPDSIEFKTIVKISGIGMVVIGFLGFLVAFVKEVFF
jgi:protein transport protein SEC61 subunit gamma-like protein